jgi:hypothetical protein
MQLPFDTNFMNLAYEAQAPLNYAEFELMSGWKGYLPQLSPYCIFVMHMIEFKVNLNVNFFRPLPVTVPSIN